MGLLSGLVKGVTNIFGGGEARGGYDQASALQNRIYGENRPLYDPYIQQGATALNQLQNFGPEALQQDPGYAFRVNQGNRYAQGLANASGRGFASGNSLRSLLNFNQNLASQEYQNAYNRLFGRAELGLNALGSASSLGQNYANNAGNLAVGRGGVTSSIFGNLLNAGASAAGAYFGKGSDIHIKENIEYLGQDHRSGLNVYEYEYAEPYKSLEGDGRFIGHMAQEVQERYPQFVEHHDNGYLMINYGGLYANLG